MSTSDRTSLKAAIERRQRRFGRVDRANFIRYVRQVHHAKALLPLRPKDPDGDYLSSSLVSARTYMHRCFTTSDPNGTPFRIYPGFVDLNRPNAFAWRHEQTYVCGIHLGLANAILEIALFCFSQRELFREIGDPGREASPRSLDGYVPGFWSSTQDGLSPQDALARSLTFFPVDRMRLACALYMTQLTLRFVWFHELYHCLNGHVGFAMAGNLALCLHEGANPDDRSKGGWQLRCLEFDADQSALWASFQIQLNDTENTLGIKVLPRPLRLKLLLFGTFATTWLFDEIARGLRRRSDTHPQPYTRLHNLIRCVATEIWPSVPGLDDINEDVMAEFDRLAEIVPTWFKGRDILAEMRGGRLQDDIERSIIALDELRPQFAAFGFQ